MFPTQRPRDLDSSYRQYPDNNFMVPNQHLNRHPIRNDRQSMLPKIMQEGLVNKGVDGVSKTLNNVQQVLKVVQTTAPIVQEYGPMVKNLPAMYKMMKAFKEMESSNDDVADSNDMKKTGQNPPLQDENIKDNEKSSEPGSREGISSPKLFI